ncbi:MAG: TSUP family transporter [Candidatus Hydrothermarchaeales archaeon]
MNTLLLVLAGLVIGGLGAFLGLGGGFLLVPLLLILGYEAKIVSGTSLMVILLISISAVIAHNKLQHIDFKIALPLAIGGIIGAQFGARYVDKFSTDLFSKIFAVILILIAIKIGFA